jgi:hypothetical protein
MEWLADKAILLGTIGILLIASAPVVASVLV